MRISAIVIPVSERAPLPRLSQSRNCAVASTWSSYLPPGKGAGSRRARTLREADMPPGQSVALRLFRKGDDPDDFAPGDLHIVSGRFDSLFKRRSVPVEIEKQHAV